jgi:Domain of unknown function (DUF4328)
MSKLARRRKAAAVVLTILSAVLVAQFVSDLFEVSLLNRMVRGADFATTEADANDTRQGIIHLVRFLLAVTTAVFFIRWFNYAYQQLQPSMRRWDTSWAIGGWFVPVLAFWRPKQIVNDLWRAGGGSLPNPLLTAWWGTWVLAAVIRILALPLSDDTVNQVRDRAVWNSVADAVYCVAAVLAIFVVRAVTHRVQATAGVAPAALWTAPERPAGLVT